MNIKIDRKLALINDSLLLLKVEKEENIFQIVAVTDSAVNLRNLFSKKNYTLSLEYFSLSVKTFLTDEIVIKKVNPTVNVISVTSAPDPIAPDPIAPATTDPITPATPDPITPVTPEDPITPETPDPNYVIIVTNNVLGKMVFRSLSITPIIQNNAYVDPYADF